MTTVSRLFPTSVGSYTLSSALLTNVVILRVCRGGLGYNTIVGAAPGNREVQYSDGSGQLTFENPFETDPDPAATFETGESIYVRYKY